MQKSFCETDLTSASRHELTERVIEYVCSWMNTKTKWCCCIITCFKNDFGCDFNCNYRIALVHNPFTAL